MTTTETAEARARLTSYPDYISDATGLDRIRSSLLEVGDWHDMADKAGLNCNSLARLLDTIEMLREKTLTQPAQGGEKKRGHVMPGDPTDIQAIALQWYLGFDFAYPHSVRESNIAVEAFKDGYRAMLSAIPDASPGSDEPQELAFAISRRRYATPSASPGSAEGDLLSGRYSKTLPKDAKRDQEWHALCVELLGIISEQNGSLKGAMDAVSALHRAASTASKKIDALATPSAPTAERLRSVLKAARAWICDADDENPEDWQIIREIDAALSDAGEG